jgi:hypothetical protein
MMPKYVSGPRFHLSFSRAPPAPRKSILSNAPVRASKPVA